MADLSGPLAKLAQSMLNLPAAPSSERDIQLTLAQWDAVLKSEFKSPPVDSRELAGFLKHWLARGGEFFPKARDLVAYIEDIRAAWPTASAQVGEEDGVPVLTVKRCPPWQIEAVSAELEKSRMPELPAPVVKERRPLGEMIAAVRDRIAGGKGK